MTDFDMRKVMWVTLGKLFYDVDPIDFIWVFSKDDRVEANKLPDGIGDLQCAGVVRGIDP